MLTAVVISPDVDLDTGIRRLAVQSGHVSVLQTLGRYPTNYELTRLLNTCDPDLVLLDIASYDSVTEVAAQIQVLRPTVAVAGFGGGFHHNRRAGSLGLHAIMESPLTLERFHIAVLAAFRTVRGHVHDNLIVLLPAKAGDGCSVTAFNLAGALATDLKRKVLLIDADLDSGVLGVRARFTVRESLNELLGNPSALTRTEWPRFVVQRYGVDLLAARGSRSRTTPRWSDFHHLLWFVTAEYDTVVVDLPDAISEATAEVLLQAAQVYLVCTPETTSLELTRRRLAMLDDLGVGASRIALVVNRWNLPDAAAENLLGEIGPDIAKVLPNDPASVREATGEGRPVDRATPLGMAYAGLARRTAGLPDVAPAAKSKSKFSLAALLGR